MFKVRLEGLRVAGFAFCPNFGESSGKEHGKWNGNWGYVVVYRVSSLPSAL